MSVPNGCGDSGLGPGPALCHKCAAISQPIILSSFHHDHIISHHSSSLAWIQGTTQGMYRQFGLTLTDI